MRAGGPRDIHQRRVLRDISKRLGTRSTVQDPTRKTGCGHNETGNMSRQRAFDLHRMFAARLGEQRFVRVR